MLRGRNDRRCSLMFLSNLRKTMVSASFNMKFMNRFDLSLNTEHGDHVILRVQTL